MESEHSQKGRRNALKAYRCDFYFMIRSYKLSFFVLFTAFLRDYCYGNNFFDRLRFRKKIYFYLTLKFNDQSWKKKREERSPNESFISL